MFLFSRLFERKQSNRRTKRNGNDSLQQTNEGQGSLNDNQGCDPHNNRKVGILSTTGEVGFFLTTLEILTMANQVRILSTTREAEILTLTGSGKDFHKTSKVQCLGSVFCNNRQGQGSLNDLQSRGLKPGLGYS